MFTLKKSAPRTSKKTLYIICTEVVKILEGQYVQRWIRTLWTRILNETFWQLRLLVGIGLIGGLQY